MKKGICVLTVSIFSLTLSACSITSVTDMLKDSEQLSKELHESPRFLYDTKPLDEYDNLSILYNEFFAHKPYNNIIKFGDNVLLVGQGVYADSNNNDEEPDYLYSFDVYNPWSNQIVASISYEDNKCDYYQVVGDRLLLFDYDTHAIGAYDLELHPVADYDYSELEEIGSTNFSFDADNNLYSSRFSNNELLKINPDSFDISNFELDLFDPSILCSSEDGKYMLMSGVDKTSLRYTLSAVNTQDFSIINSVNGQNNCIADVSDTAFISECDSEHNEWVFQLFNGDSLYFSMANLQSAMLLPDDTALLRQEEYYDEGDNSDHTVTFYQMDHSGKCLSDFSFKCPVSSDGDYTYFSTDYVYLEDCNSVMFLVYTNDVNPYILVWDLNAPHNSTAKIKSSTNPEGCIPKKASKKVTLIKDPDSYDWGKLSKANAFATELEKKYNIEIYLGPEVPKKIDVFSCKQNNDPDIVFKTLQDLQKLIECYPTNFFSQLCYGDIKGIRIYLAGDLSGGNDDTIDDPSAYVCSVDSHQVMVIDSTYSYNREYTFNHELSHMIDRRLDFLAIYKNNLKYSEDSWNALNPKGFEYLNRYVDYENTEAYSNNKDYFIDDYSTTYATEDRATIFGTAMDDYMQDFITDDIFTEDRPVYSKLKFYCECIRDGFDTTGWDDVMPWESLIAK